MEGLAAPRPNRSLFFWSSGLADAAEDWRSARQEFALDLATLDGAIALSPIGRQIMNRKVKPRSLGRGGASAGVRPKAVSDRCRAAPKASADAAGLAEPDPLFAIPPTFAPQVPRSWYEPCATKRQSCRFRGDGSNHCRTTETIKARGRTRR